MPCVQAQHWRGFCPLQLLEIRPGSRGTGYCKLMARLEQIMKWKNLEKTEYSEGQVAAIKYHTSYYYWTEQFIRYSQWIVILVTVILVPLPHPVPTAEQIDIYSQHSPVTKLLYINYSWSSKGQNLHARQRPDKALTKCKRKSLKIPRSIFHFIKRMEQTHDLPKEERKHAKEITT